MKILLDDDLETLLVKHSFEQRSENGFTVLTEFLGLFSDPISSFLSPFIKLWEIELERKKVEILQQQLKDRNNLHRHAIDARVLEITLVIKQRQREFEIIYSTFQYQFSKAEYYQRVHGQAFSKLTEQIILEKDPIRSRVLMKAIEIISNNMSNDMNGTLGVISNLVKTQVNRTNNIINQLNS